MIRCCRAGSGSPPASPRTSADGQSDANDGANAASHTTGGLPPRLARTTSRAGSRGGSVTGEPASPPLTRTGSRGGSGAVSPTILDITESWLQVAKQWGSQRTHCSSGFFQMSPGCYVGRAGGPSTASRMLAPPPRHQRDMQRVQGPAGMRQRLTSDGGDPGTPNTRQLVDEAADMLSNLLASPDKVPWGRQSACLLSYRYSSC